MGASFRAPSRTPEAHLYIPDNVFTLGYVAIADGVADFGRVMRSDRHVLSACPQLPPVDISISTNQ